MMKSLLVSLFGLCMTGATAQSWCAPGARWHHEIPYTSWGDYGYVETQYVGDILFADSLCQEFAIMEQGYSDQTNSPWEGGPFTMHTTSSPDGLVHLWDGSTFDTLFHFNAVPGDHWLFPILLAETGTRITVTDTGHASLGGLSLRYVAIEATIEDIVFVADTVFERIGPIQMYINIPITSYFLVDGGYGGLRCYEDEEINIRRVDGPCEIALDIASSPFGSNVEVFPNPTSNVVWLRWHGNTDPYLAEIHDMSGRVILRWPVMNGTEQIFQLQVSDVAEGQYVLQLSSRSSVQRIPLIIAR